MAAVVRAPDRPITGSGAARVSAADARPARQRVPTSPSTCSLPASRSPGARRPRTSRAAARSASCSRAPCELEVDGQTYDLDERRQPSRSTADLAAPALEPGLAPRTLPVRPHRRPAPRLTPYARRPDGDPEPLTRRSWPTHLRSATTCSSSICTSCGDRRPARRRLKASASPAGRSPSRARRSRRSITTYQHGYNRSLPILDVDLEPDRSTHSTTTAKNSASRCCDIHDPPGRASVQHDRP